MKLVSFCNHTYANIRTKKVHYSKILNKYNYNVKNKKLIIDDSQLKIIKKLDEFVKAIESNQKHKQKNDFTNFFNKYGRNKKNTKGIYLWGKIGCGVRFYKKIYFKHLKNFILENNAYESDFRTNFIR